MRLALLALAFAVVGGTLYAGNYDLEQMQARLVEQEARIGDLQARMSSSHSGQPGSAEGLVSLRKNAGVTIGGQVVTKYQHTNAKIDSVYDRRENAAGDVFYDRTNDYRRRADSKTSSLEISDAYLTFQIGVNDYFDAYLDIDLHNGAESDFYNAEVYYVRWKNICESGFGLKVGRDALVFGEEGVGELGSYVAGSGDGIGELDENFLGFGGWNVPGAGLFTGSGAVGGAIPMHNGWDVSGVTQITPYWEGLDGKLTAELSLFQNVYDDSVTATGMDQGAKYYRDRNGVRKYRSRNYGAGSMSARVGFEPIEDLKFTASFANYRSNGEWDELNYSDAHSKNNSVYGLAANWRPCFFNRLNVWGQYIYGHNVYFHKGAKSHAINYGASLDIIEGLTWFAQGDYLRTNYKHSGLNQRGTAWAFYTGLQYSLPYGVSFEAGWKHEQIKYKDKVSGDRLAKIKGDTLYMLCGFEF